MDAIKERVLMLGAYIRDTHATVRETAGRFGISKSTVHKDMTQKLKNLQKKKSREESKNRKEVEFLSTQDSLLQDVMI